MMVQFLGLKADYDDCLLFYRMGDFYEMFFDDAVKAAAALDIALTKRGKHLGEDIPMCGVPVHSHETYLNRLIRKGFRVAVCEQTEDPAEAKKRGSKSVVNRDVVRVVTPGTLTEDTLLDARRHNYLAAVARAQDELGFAWIDVSTGAFSVQPLAAADLDAALARLEPGEVLVPDVLLQASDLSETLGMINDRLTPLPAARFDSTNGRKRLESLFGVATLDGFGEFGRAEVAAAGALVDYIELTQKGKLPRLNAPVRMTAGAVMGIDAATRRNLELIRTLSGAHQGSLLSVMDRTVTGPGARLLATRLAQPLTDPLTIGHRLDAVSALVGVERLREDIRETLTKCPDMARALSRLTLGRGGPRDLAAVRDGLSRAHQARDLLQTASTSDTLADLPSLLAEAQRMLGRHDGLIDQLGRALGEELPMNARDGGFIRRGFSGGLDEMVALRDESRKLIAGLQADYVADTGLQGLKIKHNNVLGYFIEVPARQADKMPGGVGGGPRSSEGVDSPYIHRQTMANAMRFTTVELSELESRIAKAADGALALELELFDELIEQVAGEGTAIALAADALAELDVTAGLAELAVTRRYVRPTVDGSRAFDVAGGRHPVVEAALEVSGAAFVANDCRFADPSDPNDSTSLTNEAVDDDPGRLWLLTGPNMAGKSTFLRQNALIAVMAQMGSFVPADEARIGIVDRLFSRVGAADDLARGRSTFMVEMVETATILNQAGDRALVILDEIGRGTATYDGLSIAWAVVEYLHEHNQCRALFATHYHELTALAGTLEQLRCHSMRVKEWKGEVVFLHEVTVGAADRSYGIHVGQLAGLPGGVVARAEAVLKTLEADETSSSLHDLADDLPLFQAAPNQTPAPSTAPSGPSAVDRAVTNVAPDEMTPREALDFVYSLKRLVQEE
ncbi:MAG: DNA mismatch repair protein MutS [Rhodospirillaceae bacterium]|nr:DNA mismatch repair protein MutS [Rhodospirillaceae bacterium]